MARNYSNIAADATLSASVTAIQTTATISTDTGWPAAPFTMKLGDEVVLVGARTGTSLSSLTRGYDGTTGASHPATERCWPVAVALDFSGTFLNLEGGTLTGAMEVDLGVTGGTAIDLNSDGDVSIWWRGSGGGTDGRWSLFRDDTTRRLYLFNDDTGNAGTNGYLLQMGQDFGVEVNRPDNATIANTTIANAWLRVGDTTGLGLDPNEIIFGASGNIGSLNASGLDFLAAGNVRATMASSLTTFALPARFGPESADYLYIESAGAGDFRIRNDQQGNAITIYDGSGGVAISYNNTEMFRMLGIPTTGTVTDIQFDSQITGGIFRFSNNNGYIDIGPINTSFGHIYTDRAQFAFNKPIATTVAGTAGAPAYTFTSDSDNGMYRPGTNQLAFSTAGNLRFLIGSSDLVWYAADGATESMRWDQSQAAWVLAYTIATSGEIGWSNTPSIGTGDFIAYLDDDGAGTPWTWRVGTTSSSAETKEREYEDVSHAELAQQLLSIPLRGWRYKQDWLDEIKVPGNSPQRGKLNIGYIAEEAAARMPLLAGVDQRTGHTKLKDGRPMQYATIATLKYLQERVDELETRLAQLEQP